MATRLHRAGIGTDDIAEKQRLALLGFPVEAVERRPKLSGIFVGRLSKVEKHPNADRLQVCTVDIGGEPLTIVTAATNVSEGDIVPVATIGAKSSSGLDIAPRTMRGIESQGMLVSANEIGLEEEWFEDGILQLDSDVAPGTDVVALYRLEDDVLDVEVTSNRVDAMSVIGLARELGAAFGTRARARHRDRDRCQPPAATLGRRRRLETPDCRRFVAQRVLKRHASAPPILRCASGSRSPDNGRSTTSSTSRTS